ncbi:protocatechuate 3,4-dioxygenase subunit alpha [Corynebacterium sp.]|mgnify:CR=1 FL=1|uniref:protocatechuate 3,4-dioxygenase subunit alpha n=1 Tax=Corynebacterium sp. TaxID=1720 RepID=UPI0025C08082|nr:protocatechuate 3,4-dioxygenase subunit alpha [Corynebacterium sp.]
MIDSDPKGPYRYPVSDIRDQDEAPQGIMPSQTVGPYVHIGLTTPGAENLVDEESASFAEGDVVEVTFSVTDGAGHRVKDAMIELWQADGDGIFPSPYDERSDEGSLKGWNPLLGAGIGRGFVDDTGEVTFRTRRPGATPVAVGDSAEEAPHLKVGVFARGILERLYTRAYFPDQDRADDPVLAVVPENRRDLLVLTQEGENSYRMDIVLQHEDASAETPFFRV